MALIYNASFDSGTRVLSLLDKAGNVISSCGIPLPLTLTSQEDGSTIWLFGNTVATVYGIAQYEVDTGNGWTSYSITEKPHLTLNRGESCRWRCSNRKGVQTVSANANFGMTGTFSASGCINSMIRPDFENITSLADYPYAFCQLFKGCASLVDVTALKLPAMTLSEGCYRSLFDSTKITLPPELPATTLALDCYRSLFYGVTTLTRAPALPVTTLAEGCYYRMHYNNRALTEGQVLPATVLVNNCYRGLYYGCKNLAKVIICAQDGGGAMDALTSWLSYVASSGDAYCDPSFSQSPSTSGIPGDWDRWVYGATDTGETVTMYNNGATETFIVGTSAYGTCYSMQGWAGFRTLDQMHELGYTLQEQIAVTMYRFGQSDTIYKVDAGGDDGFTETMYNYNSRCVTIVTLHYKGYSYGAQTQISAYKTYETVTLYAVSANEGDGFTETRYCTENNYSNFQTLDWLHQRAYSLEQPTKITMYVWDTNTSGYVIQPGGADGFTDVMYDVWKPIYPAGNTGYKTIEELNDNGYYFTPRSNPNDEFSFRTAGTASTVKLTKVGTLSNTYEVNTSSGDAWTAYTFGTVINIAAYSTVRFRCASHPTTQSTSNYVKFVMTGSIEACGNCNALLDGTNFRNLTSLEGYNYAFYKLFNGCTSLTKPPALPATTLSQGCYNSLFGGCTSLAEVCTAATATATGAFTNWLNGVSASGTVYANPDFTGLPADSASGVPSGWVRAQLRGYPTT